MNNCERAYDQYSTAMAAYDLAWKNFNLIRRIGCDNQVRDVMYSRLSAMQREVEGLMHQMFEACAGEPETHLPALLTTN